MYLRAADVCGDPLHATTPEGRLDPRRVLADHGPHELVDAGGDGVAKALDVRLAPPFDAPRRRHFQEEPARRHLEELVGGDAVARVAACLFLLRSHVVDTVESRSRA